MRFYYHGQPLIPLQALSLVGILFLLSEIGFAQNPVPSNAPVFTIVEHAPQFPSGSDSLRAFLLTNVRYPADAQKAKVKGRVFVSFIVETDGHLTDQQIVEGIGYGCDEEALRVVNLMPNWQPGTQSGRAIRVKYKLPVLFGIDYPKPKKLSSKNLPPDGQPNKF